MVQKILALATVLWVFIDWIKPAYEKFEYSRYITIGISLICGILQAFMFKLDLLVAVGVVEDPSFWGTLYAGLAISGGSALVHKALEALSAKRSSVDDVYYLVEDEDTEIAEEDEAQ